VDYSVFTMRTLYTLFALISLILVALVAAPAQPNPTLDVACAPDALNTNCAANMTPTFSGGGLNSHKDYAVVATQLLGNGFIDVLSSVDKQGHYSEGSSDGAIAPDTWTFTLWELDHSGNLNKQLTPPQTLIFD
jgi:hypothetical protein